MCQIYGTENLNAETVLDITDASGHVISLCPPGQCHHFMKWIMESLLLVKIAVTRPSYGISVTEVLIDMWRGIEKRWQRIQSLGALQSGFNRTVPMRNEATVDFTQDCANFANKERRFFFNCERKSDIHTVHLYWANPSRPTSLQSSAKNGWKLEERRLMTVSITAKDREKQKKTIDFIANLVLVVFGS